MKIYAPKLKVTNTDESAPEIARITYGGEEIPIKAKTGETTSGGIKTIKAKIHVESTTLKNFSVGQNAQYTLENVEKEEGINNGDIVLVKITTDYNEETDISGLYGIFQYNKGITMDGGNNYFDYMAGVINYDMQLQAYNIFYANIIISDTESGIIIYRAA